MTGKEKIIYSKDIVNDVYLKNVDDKNREKIEPPPPKPKVEPIAIKTIKVTPPVIMKDELVKETDMPPKNEDIEDKKIGSINNPNGISGDIVAPPVEHTGTGKITTQFGEKKDIDGVFTEVQIQARYPGGPDAWKKFLERNLRQDVPVENGASTGRYTVVVSFIVDKEGNTSEVKAETDPGYGTAAEAIRVIKSSGKWQPAEQNGHTVIYRQKQVITFVIDN
jgi:protein TonB